MMPSRRAELQSEFNRPSSVPPQLSLPIRSEPIPSHDTRPASIPPAADRHRVSDPNSHERSGSKDASIASLDLMNHLQRSGPSVVKTRTGSVLSRGFILKTDHYPSGEL